MIGEEKQNNHTKVFRPNKEKVGNGLRKKLHRKSTTENKEATLPINFISLSPQI